MKSQGTKARPHARAGRKPTQTAPLTRMVVGDALRNWIPPTAAAVITLLVFVLYNAGVIEEAAAVTTVGTAALLTVLFYGLRSFLQQRLDGTMTAALVVFAVLWAAASSYPFYRAVSPGAPLFSTDLSRSGQPITVPFHGRSGRYGLAIEGRFVPADGHINRTAAYRIVLGHEGATDRVIQGAFSQTWGTQRVGAGRRSSLVPSMHETTVGHDTIDNPGGNDLTLQLTELSPGVHDSVAVRLYNESAPPWALIVISLLALAGAIVVDAWRPRGANDGLMTTMTVAAIVGIAIFRVSSAATPGFPQLAVAALMGTLAGALGGTLLWRLTQPVRRHLVRSR